MEGGSLLLYEKISTNVIKAAKSAFNPKTGTWEIGWPGRVARHDVVYLSPPADPMQGMPIGNGDVGVLCWCEESRIILAVNKCDLWDDADFDRFHNWKAEEEECNTALRHAARIIVDFKLPVFDLFYLSDFNGRISLADATLSLTASGPFGSISFKAFVSHDDGIVCCETESNLEEDVPVEVMIERYGSRTFAHWYSLVNRNAAVGLDNTAAAADEDGAYITHRLSNGTFAVRCSVTDSGGLPVNYKKEHSHGAVISISGSTEKKCTFMVAVTSPLENDPVDVVKEKLDTAGKKGMIELDAAHGKAWKSFWLRSLMETGDDYLDNLWHLTMYYANSSQRGRYPGRFINGLWGWNRDVQPWNFYFHWNQQQIYWPLNAAGHHDLLDSYLDYRFASLASAKEDAQTYCHSDGAVISDVSERRGYNSAKEFMNHTPIAQIAMDFYRQYRFTGDRDFLRKKVYPFIFEAACFFESLFEEGKDGAYHAKEGTGYEGWIKLRDCVSELVYARVLLSAAIDVSDECGIENSRTGKWRDIINKLALLPVIEAKDGCFNHEKGCLKFNRGFFKGEAAFSDKILAAGFGIAEKEWLTSRIPSDENSLSSTGSIYETIRMLENNDTPYSKVTEDMKVYNGIFPGVEYAPVYPSGLMGLSQKNTDLYEAAVNTAKLYAPDCMGWDPLPIVLARLGLAGELSRILQNWPSRWQFYCNGFGHYGPIDVMKADGALRFRTNLVRDASLPEAEQTKNKFRFPAWLFRHMGMESMSVLACAMNEALLQSHDGIIRIGPAIPKTSKARFTLHAADGFIVSAEVREGKPLWVALESGLDKDCRVQAPWETTHLYKNGRYEGLFSGELVRFATTKGDIFMLVPERGVVENWEISCITCERNMDSKVYAYDSNVRLGLPRMF